MPQRGDNNLSLWSLDSPMITPTHVFSGHLDTPTEFVWRIMADHPSSSSPEENPGGNQYELVTWGKDMNLKIWPISDSIATSIGGYIKAERCESEHPQLTNLLKTPIRNQSEPLFRPAISQSIPSPDFSKSLPSLSMPLQEPNPSLDLLISQEISLLVDSFPTVAFDTSLLLSSRKLIARIENDQKRILLQLNVTFPPSYPSTPPQCDVSRTWTLSMMKRTQLSRKLSKKMRLP